MGRDVFDSVLNYNGHIKAVSRALEEYRSKEVTADASAAVGTTSA